MISPNQFAAGERLRADFTRGNLTPGDLELVGADRRTRVRGWCL
jgi:hypothetical protein